MNKDLRKKQATLVSGGGTSRQRDTNGKGPEVGGCLGVFRE